MLVLSDQSIQSMERLGRLVEKDNAVEVMWSENRNCIHIQPCQDLHQDGINFINKIYEWLCHGEYPGLAVKNVFERYDLYSLKVCIRDDVFYDCMIQCIDDHHLDSRPYEH